MSKFLAKHKNVVSTLAFLMVAVLVLEGLSQLSIELGRDRNPFLNYSTTSFFAEPDDTIDVLAIGTSNVYSSIAPLNWWDQYGFTGYAWGEASQRIFETYKYLKKIYKVQTPRVVFLEIGDLYRDDTQAQVLDSFVKSELAELFPIIIYHHNFNPKKWRNLGAPLHSVTKGFLLRTDTIPPDSTKDYMNGGSVHTDPVNSLCRDTLKRCIDLCHRHGSQVVLLSIPDRSTWNAARHDAVEDLANTWGVPYLDLNKTLKNSINWKKDSADGGIHLNYRGADKVTSCLGNYLNTHFHLTDHRKDQAYQSWNRDDTLWKKELVRVRLKKSHRRKDFQHNFSV
jgi:hypothetical protein